MTATPEQIEALARALCALYGRAWEEHEEWRHYYTLEARRSALAVDMLRPERNPPCGALSNDDGPCLLPRGHADRHDDGALLWEREPTCGNRIDAMVCRLPAGHEGDHEGGSVRWAPDEGEVPPEAAPEAPAAPMTPADIEAAEARAREWGWKPCGEAPAAEDGRCEAARRADRWHVLDAGLCARCHEVGSAEPPAAEEDASAKAGRCREHEALLLSGRCRECWGLLGPDDGGTVHGLDSTCRDILRAQVERLRGELAKASAEHDAARAELAQSEQRWQDAQHERDQLRVELKAQGEELARLRAPVWTRSLEKAVGGAVWDAFREELDEEECEEAGRAAVEAWVAALAQGAAGEGER